MKEIISLNINHNILEGPFLPNLKIANIFNAMWLMSFIFPIDKKVGLKIKKMGITRNITMHNFSENLNIYTVSEGVSW